MPRNAIVDIVSSISPPAERPFADAFKNQPDGFRIEFRGGASARLLPGELAAPMLDLLDDLRRQSAYVYAELTDEGRAITRLLLPKIVRVAGIHEEKGGEIAVDLLPSHALHRLLRENEDFAELLRTLLLGSESGQPLLVTESERQEIIDVRPLPDDGRPPRLPPLPNWFERLRILIWNRWLFQIGRWWAYRLCYWLCCPRRFTCCVSLKRAWDMFNLVAPTSCNPINPQAPCIPFLYPDDGCWGRAHEMCRLMLAAGVKPSKVWIQGWPLVAATKNHPNCKVTWGWHVAPTLCVRTLWCTKETYVIDPSLFTGPVTVDTWKAVQSNPNATLTYTSAAIFMLFTNETDPTNTKTNQVLADHRNYLKHRSTLEINPNTGLLWGPPPYAHC